MKSRRVVIRALTAAGQYSGGRLHAWVLAEGFAAAGCDVVFWGETKPDFVQDFLDYPAHAKIQWHSGLSFGLWEHADFFVVVPHMGAPHAYFPHALRHAVRLGAKVVLLNFESPNWFNALSPVKRDPSLWDGWRYIARHADVVLSSADEGTRYAREFYTDVPLGCRFLTLSPAINSRAADEIIVARENQIVCITRFVGKDAHKGAADIESIIDQQLAGYTLLLIVGAGGVPEAMRLRLEGLCVAAGVRLNICTAITDREKFAAIKRSRLMVFPSYFEGFGYPPVEALYCGTPCVAYDLPVLREVCGASHIAVAVGDRGLLRSSIARALAGTHSSSELRAAVASRVEFGAFTSHLNRVFAPLLSVSPFGGPRPSIQLGAYLIKSAYDYFLRARRFIGSRLSTLLPPSQ